MNTIQVPVEASAGLLNDKVTVSFDGTQVVVKRGIIGRNESRIPLSHITMVRFKTRITGSGYIEFVAAGVDGKVEFPLWKKAEFAALKSAVDEALLA